MFTLSQLRTPLLYAGGVAAFLLIATLLALAIWALRDVRARTRSTLTAVATFLLVLLVPLAGLLIYLLLRPRETLAETYVRTLEEEALLRQIEDRQVCPGCGRQTQPAWFLCPHCHTHLRHPCLNCGSPLEMHWQICPYCGHIDDSEAGERAPEPYDDGEEAPATGDSEGWIAVPAEQLRAG